MIYNGKIEWFLIDGFGTQPCQVKICGKEIQVDCLDNDAYEPQTWTGTELEKGHYILRASDDGDATLHRFDGKAILEGYCHENISGGKSMWRIDLGEMKEAKSKKAKK